MTAKLTLDSLSIPNQGCIDVYLKAPGSHAAKIQAVEQAAIANAIIELDKAGFFMVPPTLDFEDFAQQLDANMDLVSEAYEVLK